ncbi:TlpA family protein disulfide reductase [Telmatocola sphagniphila]|uniref:TlpA family protein disulfide reductase n=1 Tax=Telmatocola sphagniphila TaxID=1123043 RepID=A0A8E6ETP2_9BACT|nr:TlpA disulfide reductase family protein [Telmatocola sphagniphila]QVL30355.1 TlpA family protein disulfide reductase [Telmatocola sphagniphila]
MRKLFGVTLAMLLIGLPLTAQDKKPEGEEKKPLTAKQLNKEVLDEIQKFQKENKSGDRAELLKVVDQGFERFLRAIEDNPKASDINDMVSFAARYVTSEKSMNKLGETVVLKTNILQGEKPFQVIMMLGGRNPKFLDKAMELNKSKEVTALVSFLKAQAAMSEFSESGKKEDKEKVLKLVAAVPADMALDIGSPRKYEIGKMAAKLPKKLEAIENLAVGKPMPEIISKDLDGKSVKLTDYKNKVVVLDIWATWCGPCRAMIPHEREMVEKLKDKPFNLISLSADGEVKTLKDFLEKEKMPWTHWHIGASGEVHDILNIEHYPTIFVVDHKGVIRYKEIRGEQLEEAVEKLLKEMETK